LDWANTCSNAYDAQVPVLRKYDREGRFITTIGREGGGPGEYQQATGLAISHDGTVKLWDARARRLSSFSPEGEFFAGQRVEARGFSSSRSLFVDTLGNTYVYMSFRSPREAITDRTMRGLVKLDPDGQVVDTLFEPDMGFEPQQLELTITTGTSVATTIMSIPFAPRSVWAFSPHGHYVAGVGDRYAVSLIRSGEPVLRIEREVAPVPVDPDEKAAHSEAITANMRRMRPGWRWDGPAIPDTKAAFRQLDVGLDGRIWVWRYQRAERQEVGAEEEDRRPNPRRDWPEPTVYDVFEPDGRYLGAVRIPRETRVFVRWGDYVWGITRDSLDVQYIERFRLVAGTR
jgi:hypothetical protein